MINPGLPDFIVCADGLRWPSMMATRDTVHEYVNALLRTGRDLARAAPSADADARIRVFNAELSRACAALMLWRKDDAEGLPFAQVATRYEHEWLAAQFGASLPSQSATSADEPAPADDATP